MNPTLHILLVILSIIAIKKLWDEWEEHEELKSLIQENSKKEYGKSRFKTGENIFSDLDTPALVKRILEHLNCHYQISADGKNLTFRYQGENFLIRAPIKDSLRIRLYDLSWFYCSLDNLEEMSCMQKAINIANGTELCTAVYFIDKEDNLFFVYSRADLFVWNDMPCPENYMLMWFDNMFRLKQTVVMEFEKAKHMMKVE